MSADGVHFFACPKKRTKEKTPRPKTLQFCFRTKANHTNCHAKFRVRAGRGRPCALYSLLINAMVDYMEFFNFSLLVFRC